MSNPVTRRFIQCFNHIVDCGEVRSGRQFALSLDYYPQSLNDILKGRRDVTIELLRKSIDVYAFNPLFLFTGEGEKIINTSSKSIDKSKKKIPVIRIEDRNALANHLNKDEYVTALSGIRDLIRNCLSDQIRAFEISSEDENTGLVKGDLVICRKLNQSDWSESIMDGYIYVFIDDHGVKIDRVLNFINDNGTIVLSRNTPGYNKREVLNVEFVDEVWELKYRLTKDIPNPNNINYRTDQRLSDFALALADQSETISALNNTISRLLKQNRVSRI